MHTLPNWRSLLPEFQNQPVQCDVWTEEERYHLNSAPQLSSSFQVDDDGFFVHIQTNNSDDEVLEICQISDVRPGVTKDSKCLPYMNSHYSELYGSDWQRQAFTVCSGSDLVDITYHHFMCSDAVKAEFWRESILRIARNNSMNNLSAWVNLRKQWTRLCLSLDQTRNIPVKVIAKTFASGKGEREVCRVLQEMELISTEDPTGVIDPSVFSFDRFYQLYLKLCRRDDIEELFRSTISDPTEKNITAAKFAKFLNDHQRDHRLNEILFPKKTPEAAKEIMQRHEVDENAKERNELTLDGFTRFLMSDDNSPISLNHLNVYMDMDQPLAHYYINSSHNTYLTGRQFYGKSCIEMYRQVLLNGCRCVELDCWDGEDGEPMITHGKAICTCIPFKDVLYAIRDTAFVTSQHPVILSLENHCCLKQQLKMAKYCEEIFKDLLLKEPLPDHPLEPGRPLPSPNALKGKILLKNKRLDAEKKEENKEEVQKEEAIPEVLEEEPKSPKEVTEDAFAFDSPDSTLQDSQQEDPENESSLAEWKGAHCTKDDLEVKDAAPRKRNEDEIAVVPTIPHTSSTTNIHPYLSNMVNYAQPIKFAGFEEAQRKNIHHNMSSFSETTGLSMLNAYNAEFVNYNKRQMSRIYPRGTRLDSGNFMPQIFWGAGVQMVALNFQTPDVAMQINQGKFEYNGNCGYLLKPDHLRSSHRNFHLFANSPIDGVVAAQLNVQVISGQFLSDRRIGTYVEVDMYGLPSDTIRKEFRTKIVSSNGLNPKYETSPFCFRKVIFPELALLRFGVYDETNRLLGQRVIPFDSLHSGYRHIPLRTDGNFPMTLPTLFCHIELNVYVPAHHSGFLESLNKMNSKKDVKAEAQEHQQLRKESSAFELDRRGEFQQSKSFSLSEIEGGFIEIAEAASAQIADRGAKGSTSKKGSKSRIEEERSLDFPSITIEQLKENEQFAKLLQKQEKKLRHLKMKHAKQLDALSRTQCLATEKLHTPKRKMKPKAEGGVPDIMGQVTTWSQLKEAQRTEELAMRENHLNAQIDKLERLMKAAQAKQIKELEEAFKRNTKRINSNQAKKSIKEIEKVRSDATLKSHGEKERCVREKKEQMTKLFAKERVEEERKQTFKMLALREQHKAQLKDIENERKLAMEKIENEKKAHEIDAIREFCA